MLLNNNAKTMKAIEPSRVRSLTQIRIISGVGSGRRTRISSDDQNCSQLTQKMRLRTHNPPPTESEPYSTQTPTYPQLAIKQIAKTRKLVEEDYPKVQHGAAS